MLISGIDFFQLKNTIDIHILIFNRKRIDFYSYDKIVNILFYIILSLLLLFNLFADSQLLTNFTITTKKMMELLHFISFGC